jgi:hypothetical protein
MSADPVSVNPLVVSSHDEDYVCPNCAAENRGEYCAGCGQKRSHEGDLSLGHAWHHLVHEILHFDGRIFQSIKLLFLRPGQLSLDFLEGRRARHVHPVRLFLVFSAIFLLVRGDTFTTARLVGPRGKAQLEQKAVRQGISYEALVLKTDRRFEMTFKLSYIAAVLATGLWLWVFFRSRRRYLAEHMVVALHAACVSMAFGLILTSLLPRSVIFSPWIIPAAAVSFGGAHLQRSLVVVYGAMEKKRTVLVSTLCIYTSLVIVNGTLLYVQMRSIRL